MMRVLKTVLLVAVSAVAGVFATARMLLPPRAAPSTGKREAQIGGVSVKQRLRTIAAFLGIVIAGGALVAVSGIVPIKASSGHWAVTRWFLNFGSQRSVSFHTIGGTTPSLDDPRLVLMGAGHYETGCRPCHGSPELPQPRIAAEMAPHPPYLPRVLSEWEPDELFYIVKHGIKFTGMPAWPAQQRDDEVWAMVAFLLTLPDLSAEEYARLARGALTLADEDAPMHDLAGPHSLPDAVTESCGRCHGIDGLGRGTGAFPKLAGQSPTYLYAALRAYAAEERHSGIMEPVAAGLSLEEMRALARYYGGLEEPPPVLAPDENLPAIERGRSIATEGIPRQGIPSCMDCHGPSPIPKNPFYPELAGQYAEYLVLQLELFKEGIRGGSDYAHIMHQVASRLTEQQMQDVALFYASLSPGLPPS